MEIVELHSLDAQALEALTRLMEQLDSRIPVTPAMLKATAEDPATHFFAAVEDGRIIGTACLSVYRTPTGTKGDIEDVVVDSNCRGRQLGRKLLEHILDYARTELAPIDLHLTSRPVREAANRLYQSLGFVRRETNYYKLPLA